MTRAFARHLDSLASLYDFTERALAGHDVADAARFGVHLAMEELFVNMVRYNPGVAGDIEVEVDVSEGLVRVMLVDDGGAEFDVTRPREVDTAAPLAERRPGGLGVYLVQTLVDTLDYEYKNGRGRVIFTKSSGNEDV